MVATHRISHRYGTLAASLALMHTLGCNVSSPPSSTGGVELGGTGGTAATTDAGHETTSPDGGDPAPASSCNRALAVVTGDYKSTNIAIAALDGNTLSPSFISSGATKPGLAAAISGDVDVPFVAPASQRAVLLDRYGMNVITWLDVTTAAVISQLPVGTGFESNPHDYLEVDANRAFVSRFGANTTPGTQPFDNGSDLLIIDTQTPAIIGSIPMPEEDPQLLPRPDAMNWLGSRVVVTLGRWSADYETVGDGRWVAVSPTTNHIDWTVNVTGFKACGRLVVSPSGKLAAIACSGKRDNISGQYDTAASGIVIYDAAQTPPVELRRFNTGTLLNSGIQPALAFASENTLLAKSFGGNANPGDHVFAVDATLGTVTDLGFATKPYVLGGMRCSPGCGNVCVLADAERSKLRRWSVTDTGAFSALPDVTVDTIVGLPPRSIGGL